MPTLRQLEYLVAVADILHFRRAAERCHVSQPTLSTQISALERELGVVLFERGGGHVLATGAGSALAERARDVLARTAELVEAARAEASPFVGKLRLAAIPTVAPFILPRVLPLLRREYPQLRLELSEERTADVVAGLEAGRLDVGLVALEADLGTLSKLPVARDPFLLAVPHGHRLAARRAIEDGELDASELLLLEEGHCLRTQALSACGELGRNEVGDFSATSLVTLVQMVAGGLGTTLLPESARTIAGDAREEVVLIPFRRAGPARTLGLVHRSTTPRRAELKALQGLLQRASIEKDSA